MLMAESSTTFFISDTISLSYNMDVERNLLLAMLLIKEKKKDGKSNDTNSTTTTNTTVFAEQSATRATFALLQRCYKLPHVKGALSSKNYA